MSSDDGASPPLSGLRVLELSGSPAVSFCGLMFLQGGAEVVRAPRGAGSASTASDTEIIRHAYLNDGKRDLGRDVSAEASHCDVILAASAADWPAVGIGDRSDVVTVEISPFGSDGPYRDWIGEEIVLATIGGATQYTSDEAGRPVHGHGRRYQYLAGAYAYTAALSLLSGSGAGHHVHPRIRVSELETVVSTLGYPTTQFSYNGTSGVTGQAGPRYTLACTDGFIVFGANGEWRPISELLQRDDLAADPRFATQGARYVHQEQLGVLLREWASSLTVAEATAASARHSVAIIGIADGAALLTDPLLRARDAWEPVEVPGRGWGLAPRAPYVIDGTRVARRRAAR